MDITYLKSFYTTAKYNSISKAAKQLHLTQPGLSMQLQSLENSLGKTLFERSNKGVVLTPEGKIVANYAKAILTLESNIYKEFERLNTKRKQVTIGACSNLADYALPCSVYTFKQIYQNIDINIESTSSMDVLEKIKSHELNLGIIQTDQTIPDIEQIPIIKSSIFLIGNSKQSKSSVKLDDLVSIPLIAREEKSPINKIIENNLQQHNISFDDLNIIFRLDSNEAIKTSLLCLDAYAFIPEMIIKHELRDKVLKKVFVEDLNLECEYFLIYRKDYTIKKHEQTFIDFITSSHRCFCY